VENYFKKSRMPLHTSPPISMVVSILPVLFHLFLPSALGVPKGNKKCGAMP
jgi:hypothetical protein